MLVTVERYRAITGDDTTADETVTARLEEATEALEDILDRPLAAVERTEALFPTRDGRLWPRATPITVGDGYTIDGHALIGTAPWPTGSWSDEPGTVSVTYTGGFVERTGNPDATNRLPSYIERDLAHAAKALARTPSTTSIPAGATSASVGDVTVSFGQGGASGDPDQLRGVWSRRTLAWRYAPVGTRL